VTWKLNTFLDVVKFFVIVSGGKDDFLGWNS